MPKPRSPFNLLNPYPSFSLADLSTLPAELSHHKKHFTASAVVIEQSHILLVHHRRIGAWLPPGGHVEEDECPHETAVRETKEETGIDIALLSESLPTARNRDAFFLPTPLCIHAVKARERDFDYFHIDLAYLCQPILVADKPKSLPQIVADEEVFAACWVELQNLSDLPLANNVIEIVTLAKSRLNLS